MADRFVTAEKADRTPGCDAPAELPVMADEWWQKIGWYHWKELDLWPVDAACKLVYGFNPNEPTREGDTENPDPSTRLVWVNLFHTAKAAIMAEKLNLKHGCVYPAEFIVWARGRGAQIPAQLLAMADEHDPGKQKMPTTAEGTVPAGRRAHNKRETEARHHEWQEHIDNLAQHSPGKSHAEYCRKLSKQIGVPFATIRRNTKLGHS